jgi:hypothetical protein
MRSARHDARRNSVLLLLSKQINGRDSRFILADCQIKLTQQLVER